jgi:uncharacterized membrane protein
MPNAKNFFSNEEKEAIKAAIMKAERDSSGEIKVHIDNYCKEDVLDRSAFLFEELGIIKTEQRNGVLFYLAVKDKKFAVIGDSGINALVEENFWEDVKHLLTEHFKRGEFAAGLAAGINRAGLKLKKHFPCQKDDINELSDEISFGA